MAYDAIFPDPGEAARRVDAAFIAAQAEADRLNDDGLLDAIFGPGDAHVRRVSPRVRAAAPVHPPFTGTHEHPHADTVGGEHTHAHTHLDDANHSGQQHSG